MIYFIKTPAYETKPKNQDVFEYLTKLGKGLIDPPPLKPRQLKIAAEIVLYSPAKRVRDGFFTEQDTESVELSSLQEIPFDLKKLVQKQNWIKTQSPAVRQGFKKAFIENHLLKSREKIFEEIVDVLKLCLKAGPDKQIAVISHSFRLKLIEAFIKSNGQLQKHPKIIHNYIKDAEKTYKFGEGFSIPYKNLFGLLKNLDIEF